jgi:hypothetical protein
VVGAVRRRVELLVYDLGGLHAMVVVVAVIQSVQVVVFMLAIMMKAEDARAAL